VEHKQFARHAGKFVKHVVPAAFKPVHSLWHEVLAFFFLAIAAAGAFYIVRKPPGTLSPPQLAILIIFIVVMLVYGVSSFRKARRISRS
jgi:hypothetical protein